MKNLLGGGGVINENPSVVKFILKKISDTSDIFNEGNCYLQICSTLNGLLNIKTKFVLKVRSDEYYSCLEKVVEKFDGKKMLCINIFFRRIKKKYSYHISDHLFLAEVSLLSSVFKMLKAYHKLGLDPYYILNRHVSIESRIAMFFLNEKRGYDIKYLLSKRLNVNFVYRVMKKDFDIFDVSELKPYVLRWNNNPKGQVSVTDIREWESFYSPPLHMSDVKPSFIERLVSFWR